MVYGRSVSYSVKARGFWSSLYSNLTEENTGVLAGYPQYSFSVYFNSLCSELALFLG